VLRRDCLRALAPQPFSLCGQSKHHVE
jgi:hypothetical protein